MYERSSLEDMRWQEAAFYQMQEPVKSGLNIKADRTPWYIVIFDPVARRVERVFEERLVD